MVAFLVFNVIALLATIACLIYAIINLGGNRSYDYNCSNVLEKCRCITYNMEYTDCKFFKKLISLYFYRYIYIYHLHLYMF